jgi:hypothetical protein
LKNSRQSKQSMTEVNDVRHQGSSAQQSSERRRSQAARQVRDRLSPRCRELRHDTHTREHGLHEAYLRTLVYAQGQTWGSARSRSPPNCRNLGRRRQQSMCMNRESRRRSCGTTERKRRIPRPDLCKRSRSLAYLSTTMTDSWRPPIETGIIIFSRYEPFRSRACSKCRCPDAVSIDGCRPRIFGPFAWQRRCILTCADLALLSRRVMKRAPSYPHTD